MKRDQLIKLSIVLALFVTATVLSLGAKSAESGSEKGKTVGSTATAHDHAAEKKADDAKLKLPVASIDGKPVTVGYVETILNKQSPMMRKSLEDETKRIEYLKRIVNMELLAVEAKKRGFDKDAEVVAVAKNQLASLMHRKIAEDVGDVAPGDDDLRKYYDEHIDRYRKPEKVRARHILVSDKAKAEKLLKSVKKKKTSQHEFRRLAQENSEDEATKLRGGDLNFFTRKEDRKENDPDVDTAIVEAAFKLKKNGDIAPGLIKTDKGFHILMRTGHRDKMDLSFEDAKDRLVTLVKREMRKKSVEDAINALKQRFNTEIHEENLKHVVIDLSLGPPKPDGKGGLPKGDRQNRKKALKASKPKKTD